jgi:hypothetical protein
VRLEIIVGRKSLDHLKNKFPDLLDVVLRDEVGRSILRKMIKI